MSTLHRCVSTFTEDEQTSLLETANNIASYECFLHLFEQVTVAFKDHSILVILLLRGPHNMSTSGNLLCCFKKHKIDKGQDDFWCGFNLHYVGWCRCCCCWYLLLVFFTLLITTMFLTRVAWTSSSLPARNKKTRKENHMKYSRQIGIWDKFIFQTHLVKEIRTHSSPFLQITRTSIVTTCSLTSLCSTMYNWSKGLVESKDNCNRWNWSFKGGKNLKSERRLLFLWHAGRDRAGSAFPFWLV